ncbi:MAG TPA: hypothetical protein VFT16_00055 [Candidatus Saccharimonadales bacterium]|nr:hypothetical protein [Candidatus Saccharimonadales bacterium]
MGLLQPELWPVGFAEEDTSAETIRSYLDDSCEPRFYNPLDDPSATARLEGLRGEWANGQQSVVFTSGVFDVFHGNHRAYLLAAKLNTVPYHYRRFDETSDNPWEALSPEQRKDYTDYAIGARVIKQVVSIDGDAGVAARKSFDPTKANMQRPIYGWVSRARDVVSASIMRHGETHPLVDAVTIHDPEQQELAGTPHSSILNIGRFIRPDVWIMPFWKPLNKEIP